MKNKIVFCLAGLSFLYLSACDFHQKEKKALKSSTDSTATTNDKNKIYQITCDKVGVIERKDKELQLRMKFGENAVTRDSFFLEGMFQEMITVVDKGKATELKVHWNKHGLIHFIEIAHAESPYHLSNGIKIGASLSQLASLNQKAISFYGFGWDYSGTIQGMNGGQLEKDFPCFSGTMACKEERYPSVLMGDQIVTSDFPEANQVSIYLRSMRITLNKKD